MSHFYRTKHRLFVNTKSRTANGRAGWLATMLCASVVRFVGLDLDTNCLKILSADCNDRHLKRLSADCTSLSDVIFIMLINVKMATIVAE